MTFYVLDIMCWRSRPFYNCEAEFRHFWVGGKLQEERATKSGEWNPYCFIPATIVDATPGTLAKVASGELQPGYNLDGIILSHSQAHYETGLSPVCLWVPLKSLSEVLQAASVPMD